MSVSMRITEHDLHAIATIEWRLLATGLLEPPRHLPDIRKTLRPDGAYDRNLPAAITRPDVVTIQTLSKVDLAELCTLASSSDQNNPDSSNKDIAQRSLRGDGMTYVSLPDELRISAFFSKSKRILTWESKYLGVRMTADTASNPYTQDFIAMDLRTARALDARFIELELQEDPFCDSVEVVEGEGLIFVDVLYQLLLELERRSTFTTRSRSDNYSRIVYSVSNGSQEAIITRVEDDTYSDTRTTGSNEGSLAVRS